MPPALILKLSDLEFRHCEGYYSRNEQASTWPCSISEMDSNDGMNEVYRKMILWADILVLSTPIRWGNASYLYYKMAERLNCVQNQITLQDRVLVKNKASTERRPMLAYRITATKNFGSPLKD